MKKTIVIEEKEDGSIFCEFRSNGPRVNDIASSFGGGGHMLAAGASLANWQKVDEIIEALDNNSKKFPPLIKIPYFEAKPIPAKKLKVTEITKAHGQDNTKKTIAL